jgi:hypothetical protein
MDMICGGKGEVLIDLVDAVDANNRTVYEAAAEVIAQGRKAWLITILSSLRGWKTSGKTTVRSPTTLVWFRSPLGLFA